MDCCARWIWVQSLRLLRPHLAKVLSAATSCVFWQPMHTSPPLAMTILWHSGLLRRCWYESGGERGWCGHELESNLRVGLQRSPLSTHPAWGEQLLISPILSPLSFQPSSSSSSFSACLHQSQPRGFLVVWGFPRWWLHVPLPPHCAYSPVDKAPRAWARPRRLNPRDPKPWNLWNGWLHWETPRPWGFQPRQWWLSNKDRRRGEGGRRGVKAKASGGDQGGGDWEHHKCQPSWWGLGLVGGLRLLHDPHRRWVRIYLLTIQPPNKTIFFSRRNHLLLWHLPCCPDRQVQRWQGLCFPYSVHPRRHHPRSRYVVTSEKNLGPNFCDATCADISTDPTFIGSIWQLHSDPHKMDVKWQKSHIN